MKKAVSIRYTGSMTSVLIFHNLGKRKLSVDIWKYYIDAFNCMPVAAVIADKIFCSHGGISPELKNLEQI